MLATPHGETGAAPSVEDPIPPGEPGSGPHDNPGPTPRSGDKGGPGEGKRSQDPAPGYPVMTSLRTEMKKVEDPAIPGETPMPAPVPKKREMGTQSEAQRTQDQAWDRLDLARRKLDRMDECWKPRPWEARVDTVPLSNTEVLEVSNRLLALAD